MDTNSLIAEYLEYLEHSCGFAIRILKVHKRVCKVWDQFLSTKMNKVTEAIPADIIDYIDFRQQSGKIKNENAAISRELCVIRTACVMHLQPMQLKENRIYLY